MAAMTGHKDMVQLLLDAGAKTHLADKDGWTPLHKAAWWGHSQVVELLLGTNCIKISLPGKLILSKRKGLWEVLFS